MARLAWGELPPEYYSGLDRGVIYFEDQSAPWNGLVSVDQTSGGNTDTDWYYDGVRYVLTTSADSFAAKVTAITYPDLFVEVQTRRFGMSYRTQRADGYDIHIVYNATILRDDATFSTLSNSPDVEAMTWGVTTTDERIIGDLAVSHLIIDADLVPDATETLEEALYGSESGSPRLPSPQELVGLFETFSVMQIHQNGDGTWTATGPDDVVVDNGDGSFTLNAPSVTLLGDFGFGVSSY